MILDELQGNETTRHKGNKEGREEGGSDRGRRGESPDELTRTNTEQIEEEESAEGR
jgi:hypothetical protein